MGNVRWNGNPNVSKLWLYLPDGWDAAWQAAKSASKTTPAWMVTFGDSFTQGLQSTDFVNKSYHGLIRASVDAKYSLYGDFYGIWESQAYQTSKSTTFNGTPPWVISSTGLTWGTGIGLMMVAQYTGMPANAMSFTTPYACTDLDIVWFDYQAGSWVYSVDGGGNQTVTTAGSRYLKRTQITGLANTTHTVTIVSQSADNVSLVEGIATYQSRTAGIGYAKIASNGYMLNTLTGATGFPVDRLIQWQGNGAAATGFGFPTQPSLFLMAMGINDCQQANAGLDNFRGGVRRLIQALRRGVSNCSILMVGHCFPDGVSSDTNSGATNPQEWAKYLAIMRELAHVYNCGMVDFQAKWGEQGGTLGYQVTSNFHPTDTGHNDIANTVLGVI